MCGVFGVQRLRCVSGPHYMPSEALRLFIYCLIDDALNLSDYSEFAWRD